MQRFLSWLLVLLLLSVFVAVASYVLYLRAEAGREMPAYSVYSEEQDGLAETARLLRRLGWEPVALTRPVQQLRPSSTPRLLVMVEPTATGAMSKTAARGIVRWVEEGNTLLLSGRHATTLHHELDVDLTTDFQAARDEATRQADLAEAGGYTAGIAQLLLEGRDEVQAGGLPLWWLDDKPGAVLLRRGRGRVIVVADPSLLTRRGLVRADNVLFLYNVARLHARDGRVYFDEYHHGLHSGGGFWGYLRYHQQHWALLPVLFTAGVAAWAAAVRLGPAVPPVQPHQADAVDYASALARIYERARLRRRMGELLARDFLTALTRHLGLRRSALPAELLAAWRRRGSPAEAEHLTRLLRAAGELRQSDLTNRQLLTWAQAFDHFIKQNLSA